MKRTFNNRRNFGISLTSAVFTTVLMSGVLTTQAASAANSASASFGITLIISPKLQSRITQPDPNASEDDPQVMTVDTMKMDNPTDLCVSGIGVSNFSLSTDMPDNTELVLNDQGQTVVLNDSATAPMGVADCDSGRQLTLQSDNNTQGSSEAGLLVIQAE